MLNIIDNDATAELRTETDEDLLDSIARGDGRAMHTLYIRHKAAVSRFAMRIVRDRSTAEDVVSEVFFDVWREANSFEAHSRVLTWLLAITRNKAISAWRRRTTVAFDEEFAEAIEDMADDPEVTVRKKESCEIIRECLTQLSPVHRNMLDLIYFHERSIGEVAEMIHVPTNTVKTRVFYARRRLSELLAARSIHTAHS